MARFLILASALLCLAFLAGNALSAVDGTMGTPLGGMGSGAVRFCAYQGTFYTCETTPLCMNNFAQLSSACFQLYTNRGGTVQTSQLLKAVQTNGRSDDDAIYPVQFANFGVTNNVSVTLTGFSPVCFDSVDLMCYPYAFFEVKLTNIATTAVEAAVALQISTTTNPAWVSGKGIRSQGGLERALYASSGTVGALVSAGSDNGFFTAGQCNNTISMAINRVAVKVSLASQATSTVRFIFAWYNGTTTTKDGNSIGPDRLYYTNIFNNAGSFADVGLAQFDRLRNNAVQIVTRMRASNFPDWIKDHTLNSLCNLTTNSIYTKDGRHCYTEGEWNTNGTMDQMWHARQITIMTVPDMAWKELEWWARTQKTSPLGQIHHDMGAPASKLWGFDDQQHLEYSYQPDCNPWVDLNCGFIVSIYEAYIATGNKTRLDYFWPYAKNSGQRILDQVKQYGNAQYPYTFNTSLNTYDQPGNDLNPFNGGLSIVAYRIMTQLASIYNDNALKTTYQNAFDTAKISFEKRYLTNNWPTETRFVESILAGQWLSFYLKFGQLYSQAALDYGLTRQDANYNAVANGMGTPAGGYNEWSEYLVSHYGGLCLQTGRLNLWRSMQFDYYERNYLNRNLVFNQPLDISAKVTTPTYLATNVDVSKQYISLPVLWRNYYSLLGYGRNKPTGELWLEPIIPTEMNHKITNGYYFSPEGGGTISDSESGATFQNQLVVYKPDKPTAVTTLYLLDKSTDSVAVLINNIRRTLTRTGTGYARELKVDISGTLDSSGTTIRVLYGKDITGTLPDPQKAMSPRMRMSETFTRAGDRVVLPRGLAGKEKTVTIYDLSGSRVCTAIVDRDVLDLKKDLKIPRGVYIIHVGVK